jgi:hypothetical protein
LAPGACFWETDWSNDMRERAGDESETAEWQGKPLKCESCTWLWGEINPRRTLEE